MQFLEIWGTDSARTQIHDEGRRSESTTRLERYCARRLRSLLGTVQAEANTTTWVTETAEGRRWCGTAAAQAPGLGFCSHRLACLSKRNEIRSKPTLSSPRPWELIFTSLRNAPSSPACASRPLVFSPLAPGSLARPRPSVRNFRHRRCARQARPKGSGSRHVAPHTGVLPCARRARVPDRCVTAHD